MDVPRFVNRGGRGDEPGDISVMIPYWVHRRICDMLVAFGSAAQPEEYTPLSKRANQNSRGSSGTLAADRWTTLRFVRVPA
jgi:hypothetical protein